MLELTPYRDYVPYYSVVLFYKAGTLKPHD